MNSDSFIVYRSDYPSGHPFQTQTLTLNTTNEQVFQIAGGNNAIVAVPSQTAILGSFTNFDPNTPAGLPGSPNAAGSYAGRPRPFFTSGSFDGRGVRVRAMMKFNNQAATTNAQTLTFRIRLGTNASGTVVQAQTGGTNTSATGNWIGEATLMWDATSQYTAGETWAALTAQTGTAYSTRATVGPVNITAYTSLQFVASIQAGTSNATSTATLVELSMEQV